MRYRGKLADWNDERGFGFIAPSAGGARVFAHISSFSSRRRRPTVGDDVSFSLSVDGDGRTHAVDVAIAIAAGWHTANPAFAALSTVDSLRIVGASAFVCSVAVLAYTGQIPVLMFWAYAAASVAAFVAYVLDKVAAKSKRRRIPESTLHLLGLIGGWPGALVAQSLVRHKTRKREFQVLFWVAVVLNVAGAALTVLSGLE